MAGLAAPSLTGLGCLADRQRQLAPPFVAAAAARCHARVHPIHRPSAPVLRAPAARRLPPRRQAIRPQAALQEAWLAVQQPPLRDGLAFVGSVIGARLLIRVFQFFESRGAIDQASRPPPRRFACVQSPLSTPPP
jgi:hypothetical protein